MHQTMCLSKGCLGYPVPSSRSSYPVRQPPVLINVLTSSTSSMYTLLSMVYRLFKPYWLTHFTCTYFEETNPLFNVHLNCFVNFILFPTDKYMFKANNKKIWLICWMNSKSKVNTAWHRSGVFIVDFDHNQNINAVFLLLTLNKYLSAV